MTAEQPYILLIEDSRSQALQFKHLAERASGYPVQIYQNGVEGWKKACADPPLLVLLDINLPMLDGFQILGRLKRNEQTTSIPVIMLTTSESIGDVEQSISLGANDYVFKDDLFHSKEAVEQFCLIIKQFASKNTPPDPGCELPE